MEASDRAYLLDLCDELLGPGERDHGWPWLRDDEGDPLLVDGFWSSRQLALLLLDGPTDRWRYALGTLALRGSYLLGIDVERFDHDADGRLVREPSADRRQLAPIATVHGWMELQALPEAEGLIVPLGAHDARGSEELSYVFDSVDPGGDHLDVGEPPGDSAGDEHGHSREEQDEAGRAWEEPYEHDGPWDPDEAGEGIAAPPPVFDVGWRALPIALATLEASILARRAFGPDVVSGERGPLELQLLIAIADIEPRDGQRADDRQTTRGLATRLALRERTVADLAESLVAGELLRPNGAGHENPEGFALTDDGRELLLAWLARIAPLFEGWPPKGTGADDAA
ncbi:hypothetical protein PAI11_05210 [Patulibacter medicamentivorans]|uniref:Uncharacterized protein n=1 Tax=Patulibacter medicamentivorans TaxID=1097667 RepID=H0E161_9ACTN|nr:hypothetical protein [Patulibacter medicamentivorans]EHN12581.1 hypothetical protein PAI11_05210 [Patulibacter medicamentivorans]